MRPADFAGHRLALYAFSAEVDALRERIAEATGGPVRGAVKVSPVDVARALAARGYITFLPQMAVARDLAEGTLKALTVADLPVFRWEVALLTRSRKQAGPEVAAVLAAMAALGTPDLPQAVPSAHDVPADGG